MKFKKYIILLLTLFVSFGFVSSVDAMTLKEFESYPESERESILNSLSGEERTELLNDMMSQNNNLIDRDTEELIEDLINKPGEVINNNNNGTNNNKNNSSNNDSSSSGSGSWCTDFNNVWYVFGIAIQVIYVATPLLLIISGSITMLQAMTKHDPGAINKAQKALVNKIIAAVVVFLMISIVKMVTAFVADDGWVSCANCAFNPNQENCEFDKVQTGQ